MLPGPAEEPLGGRVGAGDEPVERAGVDGVGEVLESDLRLRPAAVEEEEALQPGPEDRLVGPLADDVEGLDRGVPGQGVGDDLPERHDDEARDAPDGLVDDRAGPVRPGRVRARHPDDRAALLFRGRERLLVQDPLGAVVGGHEDSRHPGHGVRVPDEADRRDLGRGPPGTGRHREHGAHRRHSLAPSPPARGPFRVACDHLRHAPRPAPRGRPAPGHGAGSPRASGPAARPVRADRDVEVGDARGREDPFGERGRERAGREAPLGALPGVLPRHPRAPGRLRREVPRARGRGGERLGARHGVGRPGALRAGRGRGARPLRGQALGRDGLPRPRGARGSVRGAADGALRPVGRIPAGRLDAGPLRPGEDDLPRQPRRRRGGRAGGADGPGRPAPARPRPGGGAGGPLVGALAPARPRGPDAPDRRRGAPGRARRRGPGDPGRAPVQDDDARDAGGLRAVGGAGGSGRRRPVRGAGEGPPRRAGEAPDRERVPAVTAGAAALKELLAELRTGRGLAILTGTGVSSECGLPPLSTRGEIWEGFAAAELASAAAFESDPVRVWRFYEWRRQAVAATRPGEAHLAVARIQRLLGSTELATLSVDGLHRAAG
ncbi:hypothetical protein FBQ97_17605, partial [Acidobacteria bacterium ACD]|nr:hypothetical protein [Acidobacteria bacterium ACD]